MPLTRKFFTILLLGLALQTHAADYKFELVTAKYETVAVQRGFDATVEAVNKSTIAAQVSERITAIHFDVDDYVEQGAILLKFRNTQQRARLEQALAGVREANVRSKDAETELKRIREVYAKKLVAKAVLDKTNAAFRAAAARLQQAEARLKDAREQFDKTIVKAPYSGIVTKRHVELGETPGAGQPLMTGLSLDKLRVVAEVPQRFIAVLRDGCCPARVLLPGDAQQSVEGKKLTIFPIADEQSRSFRIRVDLDDGQHGLYPGMFVRLMLDVAEQHRLLIPAQALVRRGEVSGVYVADKGMVFRHVRVGNSHADGRVEIHAGLEAGERVALDPVAAGIFLKGQLPQ